MCVHAFQRGTEHIYTHTSEYLHFFLFFFHSYKHTFDHHVLTRKRNEGKKKKAKKKLLWNGMYTNVIILATRVYWIVCESARINDSITYAHDIAFTQFAYRSLLIIEIIFSFARQCVCRRSSVVQHLLFGLHMCAIWTSYLRFTYWLRTSHIVYVWMHKHKSTTQKFTANFFFSPSIGTHMNISRTITIGEKKNERHTNRHNYDRFRMIGNRWLNLYRKQMNCYGYDITIQYSRPVIIGYIRVKTHWNDSCKFTIASTRTSISDRPFPLNLVFVYV